MSNTRGAVLALMLVTLCAVAVPAQSYKVLLSWSAPVSSPDPVSGYNVYRALVGSPTYQLVNSSPTASVAYTDTAVQNGASYIYYVESVDAQGNTSVPSNTWQVTIPQAATPTSRGTVVLIATGERQSQSPAQPGAVFKGKANGLSASMPAGRLQQRGGGKQAILFGCVQNGGLEGAAQAEGRSQAVPELRLGAQALARPAAGSHASEGDR